MSGDNFKETIPFGRQGQTATSSTAARLVVDNTYRPLKGVILKAPASNSAAVFIGDYRVTTSNGLPIDAGGSLMLAIDNPGDLWVVSAAAQNIAWILL